MAFSAEVKQILNKYAQLVQADLAVTTVKFQRVTPKFLIEKANEANAEIRVIGVRDDEHGKIWGFLNDGTKVRYAVLSPDWESKTTPHTFNTGNGAGRVLFIDTSRPMKGIEARLWTELSANTQGEKMQKEIDELIDNYNFFK